MKTFTTFSLILLSTSTYVNALPTVGNFTFPLIRLEGTVAYLNGAANASRARATLLKSRTPVGPSTIPMSLSGAHFIVKVGVGNPVAYKDLLVDTGSAVTWIKTYTKTDTGELTGQEVRATYGAFQFTGSEYLDDVTLAPGLVITKQSIGSLSPSSIGFDKFRFQGILGLGHYGGDLTYFPLTKTFPASQYWGIDLRSCKYGSDMIIQTPIAGIVDSGNPKILIPDDVFQVYMNAIPRAELDTKTGLIEIPPSSIEHMKPLHFKFGDHTFTLDGNSQLFPQWISRLAGGDTGKRHSVVCPIGHVAGRGSDFVLGIPFMEKYYTVFDAERQQIGFAEAT
ncbi:Aspartic peptidase domain containing protein [Tylopilus felleus]